MDLKERVNNLLKNQKEILREYEEILKEINEDNSIGNSIENKNEIKILKGKLQESEEKIIELQKENMHIKNSLEEQSIKESNRDNYLSIKKVNKYFKSKKELAINNIYKLEKLSKSKIDSINRKIAEDLKEKDGFMIKEINAIEKELDKRLKIQEEKVEEAYRKTANEIKSSYRELENRELENRELENRELESDNKKYIEVKEKKGRKEKKDSNLEVNIGLNWINRIGIILLLFGVATGMKYTYEWLNEYMKGILGFLIGGVMLGAGEYFNNKERNLFSLGLCGGGIGTLYLTVFASYFFLEILSLPISIIISILITIGAFALSLRYDSQTIAGISLVGGYLPFFSLGFIIGLEGSLVYIAMGYLFILNLLVLMMAVKKRWIFINYLSFILNMPCLIYLVLISGNIDTSIIYSILIFGMYLGITLVYPIRENIKLRILDLVLLALNTFINSVLVYLLFLSAELNDYMGFLALIYAIGYFYLSRLINKKSSQEKHVEALFSITALTFTILMVPLQFGIEWAAMGWLIESILILTFAKKGNIEKIELGGLIILGLCTLGFILNDFVDGWLIDYFAIRYSLITLGLIYVLSLYIPEYSSDRGEVKDNRYIIFNGAKYFIVANSLVYLLRMAIRGYDLYIGISMPYEYIGFYRAIIVITINILFSYGLLKIKSIRDKIIVGISTSLLLLTNISIFLLNFTRINRYSELGNYPNLNIRLFSIGILIIYNIVAFFSIKDIILKLIKKKELNIEYYPLAMAVYLIGTITIFITRQFYLQNINLIISIILVISSLACITFGFKKDYLYIRRFGLGLSIFSTAKLFIIDLINLTGIGRIIAYFSFGLVLLAISFIYQRLKSNLEGVDQNE